MTTRKTTLLLALFTILFFVACKKETTFKYKASCTTCKISYYDENGNFVKREDYQGSFEKEISVKDFSPVMIAVQSSVCPQTGGCDSSVFINDVITVELWKSGEKIAGDTSVGKKLQAVTSEYDWQK